MNGFEPVVSASPCSGRRGAAGFADSSAGGREAAGPSRSDSNVGSQAVKTASSAAAPNQKAMARAAPRRRLRKARSSRPSAWSSTIAKAAAKKQPNSIMPLLRVCRPVKMYVPSPLAPTAVASVVRPTTQIVAVRRPAMMTGKASGKRTRRRICRSLMPNPRAASIKLPSIESRPVIVFCNIGRTP